MTFWEFLDRWGQRSERRAERLIRAGFYDPKFVVAAFILAGFAGAYVHNPSETMTGAIIAAFAGAWGYYLGSSNSSNAIRDQVGHALRIADKAQSTEAPPKTAVRAAAKAAKDVAGAAADEADKFTTGEKT
jgi:hypothetical protein